MKSFYYMTVLLLLLLAGACQKDGDGPRAVRIGLIAYTEDVHADTVGQPTINAARLAVDEVNRTGGVRQEAGKAPVELVIEGIASSPQNAVAAMRKLTNRENVAAIVGLQYSVDAIPAGEFADRAHVPFISPMSTNARTTRGRDYVFRMSFVDELQGSVMARYAFEVLGGRRAAVMFDHTDPYSSGISDVFATTFKDLGGAVVSYQAFNPEAIRYDEVFDHISQNDPDILYLPGFSADVRQHVRQARHHGLQLQLLGADGWNADEFSRNPDFKGSYMTSHWVAGSGGEVAEAFATEYRKAYGKEPEAVAALTYDAVKLVLAALAHGGRSDGESLRQALIDMDAFAGVTGAVDFIENGDPVKGVLILHLQDGKARLERVVGPGGS